MRLHEFDASRIQTGEGGLRERPAGLGNGPGTNCAQQINRMGEESIGFEPGRPERFVGMEEFGDEDENALVYVL